MISQTQLTVEFNKKLIDNHLSRVNLIEYAHMIQQ